MDEQFREDLYLAGVAEQFGVNDRYLSHRFSDHVGTPFSEYLARLGCREAGELLLTTDLTVRDVGERVGFGNQTTFFRTFKSIRGVSPSAFRSTGRPSGDATQEL